MQFATQAETVFVSSLHSWHCSPLHPRHAVSMQSFTVAEVKDHMAIKLSRRCAMANHKRSTKSRNRGVLSTNAAITQPEKQRAVLWGRRVRGRAAKMLQRNMLLKTAFQWAIGRYRWKYPKCLKTPDGCILNLFAKMRTFMSTWAMRLIRWRTCYRHPWKICCIKTIVLKWLLVNQGRPKLMLHEFMWQIYPNAFEQYTEGILWGFP